MVLGSVEVGVSGCEALLQFDALDFALEDVVVCLFLFVYRLLYFIFQLCILNLKLLQFIFTLFQFSL